MKTHDGILKLAALLAVLALISGCATTTTEEKPAEEETREVTTPAPAETTTRDELPTSYNVARGDHLWGIASKPRIYGNPYQWPLIYKANSDQIQDADLIYPGQVLAINRTASYAEIDAAIRHAKTRGAWSIGVTEESDKRYLAQ